MEALALHHDTNLPFTMSKVENEIYARCLLPTGHGYPLWDPQPYDNLCREYREEGVRIGDVGVITSDGTFDFLFNICAPATDPINLRRTPEDFEPVTLVESEDIQIRPRWRLSDSHIASIHIEKKRLEGHAILEHTSVPAALQAVYEFTSSDSEGAILCLPDGAIRTNLLHRDKFRQTAIDNALKWYHHANVRFGRLAPNGSLYLVTGCDKAISWGVASFACSSQQRDISLKFTTAKVAGLNVTCGCAWEACTPANARVGPYPDGGGTERLRNQCVFIRGFKISIRGGTLAKWKGTAKLIDIDNAKGKEFLPGKGKNIPFAEEGKHSAGKRKGGNGKAQGPSESNDQSPPLEADAVEELSSEDDATIDMYPSIPEPYHPSTVIHRWMLHIMPDSDVAITHDDDWCGVLNENLSLPNEEELLRLVSEKYTPRTEANGVILVPRNETTQSEKCAVDLHLEMSDGHLPCPGNMANQTVYPSNDQRSLRGTGQPTGHLGGRPESELQRVDQHNNALPTFRLHDVDQNKIIEGDADDFLSCPYDDHQSSPIHDETLACPHTSNDVESDPLSADIMDGIPLPDFNYAYDEMLQIPTEQCISWPEHLSDCRSSSPSESSIIFDPYLRLSSSSSPNTEPSSLPPSSPSWSYVQKSAPPHSEYSRSSASGEDKVYLSPSSPSLNAVSSTFDDMSIGFHSRHRTSHSPTTVSLSPNPDTSVQRRRSDGFQYSTSRFHEPSSAPNSRKHSGDSSQDTSGSPEQTAAIGGIRDEKEIVTRKNIRAAFVRKREKYTCDICGDDFIRKFTLERHFDLRHGTGTHRCREGCDQRFTQISDRRKHELQHESHSRHSQDRLEISDSVNL